MRRWRADFATSRTVFTIGISRGADDRTADWIEPHIRAMMKLLPTIWIAREACAGILNVRSSPHFNSASPFPSSRDTSDCPTPIPREFNGRIEGRDVGVDGWERVCVKLQFYNARLELFVSK
ncbi:uncharacterized protein MYCFIDRAFT_204437 [Pseudocercospora fijiensis CIRAD86]|uniref:Uncharacterized protein n=1 Tax=Pseudocercospora fijiensis (strain CIRAD86) TaxID=383855 RepID=M3A612_PSEFD|nr:uncharacterized protein MYCFIDRAFT_204437 [Pseudocercospora fijiensis CIRAD86]EME80056.1 hypothetical protein MYCFIDRAFT_204437 [Pseudocercospora fijiensis CIRAD86]